MPWHSAFNPQSNQVELSITGLIDRDGLAAACDSTVGLALEHHRPCVLTDCSQMRGGHNSFDLYMLAKRLAEKEQSRELREALVAPVDRGIRELLRFWETACLNRGLLVRLFETRGEAQDWLREATRESVA
jgi:hypothetical protein